MENTDDFVQMTAPIIKGFRAQTISNRADSDILKIAILTALMQVALMMQAAAHAHCLAELRLNEWQCNFLIQ